MALPSHYRENRFKNDRNNALNSSGFSSGGTCAVPSMTSTCTSAKPASNTDAMSAMTGALSANRRFPTGEGIAPLAAVRGVMRLTPVLW